MAFGKVKIVVIAVVFLFAGFEIGVHVYEPQLSDLRHKAASQNYEISGLEYQVEGLRYENSALENQVSDLQAYRAQLQELLDAKGYSEIWLLDSAHEVINYPFLPISLGQNCSVYLEVGNHLGSLANYNVYVRFLNQTQPLPTNSTPSPMPSIDGFSMSIQDGGVWNAPMTFVISSATLSANTSTVTKMNVNGVTSLPNVVSRWDEERNGYYYQLIFELWLYSGRTSSYQYHGYFANLWLRLNT